MQSLAENAGSPSVTARGNTEEIAAQAVGQWCTSSAAGRQAASLVSLCVSAPCRCHIAAPGGGGEAEHPFLAKGDAGIKESGIISVVWIMSQPLSAARPNKYCSPTRMLKIYLFSIMHASFYMV